MCNQLLEKPDEQTNFHTYENLEPNIEDLIQNKNMMSTLRVIPRLS
jgi:hypothetical protein